MVPKDQAFIIPLPDAIATRVGDLDLVLVAYDDNDLIDYVYSAWEERDGSYEVDGRLSLTPDEYALISDAVTRSRGGKVVNDAANMIARSMANAAATRARLPGRTRKVRPEDPRLVAGPKARTEEV